MRRFVSLSVFLFGCSATPIGFDAGPAPEDASADVTPVFQFSDASNEAAPIDAGSCDPPEMLVILDRSESMSTTVGTQGTRIDLAMAAIDKITQPPTDTALRFGLQVLPQIGGVECSTQLVVPMGLAKSGTIHQALTTMVPQLDFGTPIGAALTSAAQTLAKTKVASRKQYVLLVTDGGECCSCNTNDYDVAAAQQLALAGIETFVVGFGGDDDPILLNDLACAGHTATNFATSCACTTAGCKAATQNPTTPLYFKASDGAALKQSLASIANQTCCGCNVSPN